MSKRFESGRARPAVAGVMLLPSIVLLLTGFLTMLSFWEFGHHPASLPGLFHYRSVTWGDGLLLPLVALSLTIMNRQLPGLRRSWPTQLAGAAGLAAGALLMLTWWADPHPVPNWTIPRAHHFTIAGWWHAGFLSAACWFFAAEWAELFRRLRAASGEQARRLVRSPIMVVGVGCSVGYVCLGAADSAPAHQTVSGQGALAGLALASVVVIGCLYWTSRGNRTAALDTKVRRSREPEH